MYAKTKIENAFKQDTQFVWDIDTPKFLNEIIECSGQRAYKPTWDILLYYLKTIAQRATEIKDPVLDALMIRMNMYEISHKDCDEILKRLETKYNNKVRKH